MRTFRTLLLFFLGACAYGSAQAQNTPTTPILPIIRFISNPPAIAIVNREYRYQSRALGRDSTASIRYRLTSAPRGMALDSITGILLWTTTASAAPSPTSVRVSIRAAMATNANQNVTQTFNITVIPESAAQSTVRFVGEAPRTASVGAPYTYQAFAFYGVDPVLATPPRMQTGAIQYTLIGAPQGMTIDATRGTVRWTPSASGTLQFSIRATSTTVPTASATQNVEIRVTEPRPIFITNPPTEAFIGQGYIYNAIAALQGVTIQTGSRPNEATVLPITQRVPMLYSLVEAPGGMTVDANSGIVRWQPVNPPTTATVRVLLRASVVGGSTTQTVTQDFRIRVSTPKMLFTSQPPRAATVGQSYVYQPVVVYGNLNSLVATVTRPDSIPNPIPTLASSTFTFSLINPPQGMAIDATRGTVRWAVTTSGLLTISIRAALKDNPTLSTTQTYQVNVALAPITLRFTTEPGSVFVDVGREFVYRARAETSRPTTATIMYSLGTAPTGAQIDSLTGDVRWTPTIAGQFDLEIIARLPNGTTRPAETRQRFPIYARATLCGVLQGTARYTDGSVVASGTARALVTNVTAASLGGSAFYYTATIRNGVYSMPVGAGSYILNFSGSDFNDVWFAGTAASTVATASTPDRAVQITVRCGDTLTRSVVVQRRPAARFFAVSGRVTRRTDGAAVAGMVEAIGDADPALVNGGIIRRTARTDAQGNYRLTQLDNRYIFTIRALPDEPRPTTATVRPPQLLPMYYDNTLNLAEARRFTLTSDLTGINFALQERPTFNNILTGKVQSTSGAAIPGRITVFMTATTANTPQYASLEVRTETVDSTGTFTVRNLTPGEYVLQAFPNNERDFASGYYVAGTTATTRWREAARLNIGATSTERITIALAPRRPTATAVVATVSGSVSSEAGFNSTSVLGASVYLTDKEGNVVSQTVTDKQGRFNAGMIEHGLYTLIVDKPGYESATAKVLAEQPAAIEKSIILQKPVSAVLTSISGGVSLVQTLGVAPNPASDAAFIQIPSFSGAARLSVVNMRGEEVFGTDITTANTTLQLDAHNLPTGIYLVRIIGENVKASVRMMIAR
ncbi:MAG: carboxypeptidase regulatory-like domain-containing protein [Candidatus Kapabacteria bacterium]|nr:carboxypeptidase regulatory-like domain-containing protein [Candidatus Kapabacteria bacterium]